MKNKFLHGAAWLSCLLLVSALALFVSQGFENGPSASFFHLPTGEGYASKAGGLEAGAEVYALTPKLYTYSFTKDTISNALNDTLSLPATDVQSLYTWAYYIARTNISGTTNVSVKVQESGIRTGNTDWVDIATSAGTGATNERLAGDVFYGRRQRLIVDGTGTQSSSYTITAVLKLR